MKIQIEVPVVTKMLKEHGRVYFKVMAHVGPVYVGTKKGTLKEAQEGCAEAVLRYFGYVGPAKILENDE